MLALAFALLSAASSVLAHGNVQEITVGSPAATFTSYLPFSDPYKSPVPDRITRKFPSNGPVEDITLADIQCNTGAVPAALVAPVVAGSQIAFNWTDWPTSHVGPVITYMARAPSDITQWSPNTDAVWFKIDEAGLEDGKWAATDVLLGNNGIWPVTIPASLKPGQYLIRHEIIALHSAGTYPGAQFYPMCAQFEVTGDGTALPDDSTLVSFPGAYTATTPGIAFNVYTGLTDYPIPGPAVWDGTGSGTGVGSGSSSGSTTAVATSAAAATSTAAASSTAAAPATTEVASSVETEVVSSTEAASSIEVVSSTEVASSIEVASSTEAAVETSVVVSSATTVATPATTTAAAASSPASCDAAAPSTTAAAGALAAHYAQCGGTGFNGPTSCVSPYTCKQWNPYYSQCV